MNEKLNVDNFLWISKVVRQSFVFVLAAERNQVRFANCKAFYEDFMDNKWQLHRAC